jgi:hypothetical protein
MSDDVPAIDDANLPAPSDGFVVTMFITVRNVARSRRFAAKRPEDLPG